MNTRKKMLTGTVGVFFPFVLAMTLIFSEDLSSVNAHGTLISYEVKTTIDILATFDDGLPMPNAEITIFSPEDPTTAWDQGIADEDGRFSFTPDSAVPGNWDVRVRQAGHGDIITIPIGADAGSTVLSGGSNGQTNLQRLIMAAAVIWGFVGTALYFSSRGKQQHAYS